MIIILLDKVALGTKKKGMKMPGLSNAFISRYNSIFILAYKPFSRNTAVFIKWYMPNRALNS